MTHTSDYTLFSCGERGSKSQDWVGDGITMLPEKICCGSSGGSGTMLSRKGILMILGLTLNMTTAWIVSSSQTLCDCTVKVPRESPVMWLSHYGSNMCAIMSDCRQINAVSMWIVENQLSKSFDDDWRSEDVLEKTKWGYWSTIMWHHTSCFLCFHLLMCTWIWLELRLTGSSAGRSSVEWTFQNYSNPLTSELSWFWILTETCGLCMTVTDEKQLISLDCDVHDESESDIRRTSISFGSSV